MTMARTRWMLGSKRRLVRRCEWDTLWPKPGPFAQMSQTAATAVSWRCKQMGELTRIEPGNRTRIADGSAERQSDDQAASSPATRVSLVAAALDPTVLRRWSDLALTRLGQARGQIDSLNVYPVPDRDTGTNLYLTFEVAHQALLAVPCESSADPLSVLAAGALRGARGSSGVILAQLLRAAAESVADGGPASPGQAVAAALSVATDAAYAAVERPVEGTMLTVVKAAAAAARTATAQAGGSAGSSEALLTAVIAASAAAAAEALALTPDLLPVLHESGVVDAGGRGVCVLLDAAEELCSGAAPVRSYPMPPPSVVACDAPSARAGGPSYEVMYLLDAGDDRIPALRERLSRLGDELVVVGGDGFWNVHVHVDDVGAALEAGIGAGRPHEVRVTRFAGAGDVAVPSAPAGAPGEGAVERPVVGVVAVAAGAGLAALFETSGAVVAGRPGDGCSAGDVLAAIRSTGSTEVLVLPNDRRTLEAAEAAAAAARHDGLHVVVIPTRAQVEGLAAVAVHQPGRRFDEELVAMSAAASHTRHGAVTIASHDAMTTAGPCRAGDVLGIVDGDFAVVGDDLGDVAVAVVDRLLGAGGELLTLVTGMGEDSTVEKVAAHVHQRSPDVEVAVHAGGQRRYPLLIGVE